MTGSMWFFTDLCILVIWTNVASALEGLNINGNVGLVTGIARILRVCHRKSFYSFGTTKLRACEKDTSDWGQPGAVNKLTCVDRYSEFSTYGKWRVTLSAQM